MVQSIIAISQFIIFAGYAAYIAKKYGVLPSVSTSTYRLEGQDRWLFLAALWAVGISNLFMGLGVFGFLASAGIIFTGITINHRSGPAKWLHLIAVVSAIVLTFTGFIVMYGAWQPVVALAAGMAFIILYRTSNEIWWLELYAMACAMIGYLMIHG